MPFSLTHLPLRPWYRPTFFLYVPRPVSPTSHLKDGGGSPINTKPMGWTRFESVFILCFYIRLVPVSVLIWDRITGQRRPFYLWQKCTKSDSVRLNPNSFHYNFFFLRWRFSKRWQFPLNWFMLLKRQSTQEQRMIIFQAPWDFSSLANISP